MDADGIPLYIVTNWQKALFLDQMDGAHAFISLPPVGDALHRGVPAERMGPGNSSKETPPSDDESGGVLLARSICCQPFLTAVAVL